MLELDRLPAELRPTPALMKYYALASLVAGPFFVFPLVAMFARYRSLRYRIDEDGISMRWGVLFRREVSLNYGRIQDIHLTSNLVERWLGLGKIQVQTASGSSKAEMTVEGVPDLYAMRDFLYDRMHGARGEVAGEAGGEAGPRAIAGRGVAVPSLPTPAGGAGELTAALRAVADELRGLRREIGGKADGTR